MAKLFLRRKPSKSFPAYVRPVPPLSSSRWIPIRWGGGQRPLSYRECMKFHENMSDLDSVRTYLTVGGIPKYHRIMCESTYKEAIVNHFLSKDADLFGEGAHVITNELPSVSYTSIAACIADGYVTQYEIADKIRMDRAQCKLFIGRLENIGVVERQHMMLDSPKRPRYTIRDSIVAFYFEVMRSVSSEVMGSADDDLKYRMSEHRIDTFLGHRFEQLCGEYLDEHFCLKERGKWTGKDSELDIVAKAVGENLSVSFIFAECKFTRNAMDMSQFNEFAKTVSRFRDTDNKRLMLFSANGFDRKLRGFAETNDVELIDLAGLLG